MGACLGEDETGGTEEVVFGRRRSVPVVKDEVKEGVREVTDDDFR